MSRASPAKSRCKSPASCFLKDYASVLLLFVQLVPGILHSDHSITCQPRQSALSVKKKRWQRSFLLKSWEWRKYFSPKLLVSFVKLMAYGVSASAAVLFLVLIFVSFIQLRAFQYCVDRAGCGMISPAACTGAARLTPGNYHCQQSLRSLRLLHGDLPAESLVCPRCHTVCRRKRLQWTLALLFTSIMLYLPTNILPIMITGKTLGSKMPSTILAGIVDFCCGRGSYPVAAVIFLASIMVPTLK